MNADASSATRGITFFRRPFSYFQQETGQSLVPWLVVALLSFLAQIVFRRALAPGEFGTLNTVLGVVGLFTVPALALTHTLTCYLAQDQDEADRERTESLRAARLFLVEIFVLSWGAFSLVLLLGVLPLLDLPRTSLQLFTLLNVFVALGAVVSGAVGENNLRAWGWFLMAAALTRVWVGAGLANWQPWAESALSAFLFAGLITLIPALRQREIERDSLKAWRAVQNGEFLWQLGATFSVFLAVYLFSSADRIVAQSWFGTFTSERTALNSNSLGTEYSIVTSGIDWRIFDSYQTGGLLGRALLWGTQPLLLIFFVQRSRLERTTSASLRFFWIYLGALFLGAILLGLLADPLSWIFCGSNFQATAFFTSRFALTMVPLGLLQALGIFALASRRYPECFTLGGASVGFTLLLYLVGRQPQLMLAYMFGGGVTAIMLVLFVGVIRWGRRPEHILWNKSGPSR